MRPLRTLLKLPDQEKKHVLPVRASSEIRVSWALVSSNREREGLCDSGTNSNPYGAIVASKHPPIARCIPVIRGMRGDRRSFSLAE